MDTGYSSYAYEFADTGRHSGAPFWLANFQFDSNPELLDGNRVEVSITVVFHFLKLSRQSGMSRGMGMI